MASRIEDYALIGDCRSAALVSRTGSIDWLCWPRFDSSACFAALLGEESNGFWRITAADPAAKSSRRYAGDTMVLETSFETSSGTATLTDFMALDEPSPTLVRVLKGVHGTIEMRLDLVIRFDFGLTIPWVWRGQKRELIAVAGPMKLILRTPARLVGRDMRTQAKIVLHEGEEIPFVLQCGSSVAADPQPVDWRKAFDHTRVHWQSWADRCRDGTPWHEDIKRSLLTLKALTFTETGGIVAAPTTSLPEFIGGVRNWDYRYCWLRDSTFTLIALMSAGYFEEAVAWRNWLVRVVAGAPDQVQIMYGVGGERFLDERELPWLKGYEASQPVRIGNAAAAQLQLDVYGEVVEALYRTYAGQNGETEGKLNLPSAADGKRRGGNAPQSRPVGRMLLEHLEKIWRQPDEGIWEVRGPRRHFVHSKIMAWVAFDRALRAISADESDWPLGRWRAVRDEIHAEICEKGFDPKVGAFMQSYGSDTVDASVLLAPLVGFLPADDPRIVGTVAAIEKRLLKDGYILRYEQQRDDVDGLPSGEGAFLACSFWYVDVLVMQGRLDEARSMFESLIGLCNDVGLLAEEYDPAAGRMLGNFPQAFSHVSLVNSAYGLAHAFGGTTQCLKRHTGEAIIQPTPALLQRS